MIADNHSLLRAGLTMLLRKQEGIQIVGEVSNGADAIEAAVEMKPDVILMDLSMPGIDGLEATRRIREVASNTKVVVLTRYQDYAHMNRAIECGASGYVLKSSNPSQLIEALRIVDAGRTYIDPGIQLPRVTDRKPTVQIPLEATLSLSEREREVLRATASGESSKEIANRLDLSTRTVEFHKYKAMRKLGLRGRAALVRLAVQMGWLSDY